MRLLILSGMSGSGKSTALHALEDLDYYCIDNLPAGLLPAFAQKMRSAQHTLENAAVGIDARNLPGDLVGFGEILKEIHALDIRCDVIFLTADEATLIKRFSETRRKHPLTAKGVSLRDAIKRERQLLTEIADLATLHIDSSRLTLYDLRDLIRERIAGQDTQSMSILFQSFGFKHGLPSDADFVFDVRCIPNPYWEPRLRPLTGLDQEVKDYLEREPAVGRMRDDLVQFISQWLPSFAAANKTYMTIAIGCTGGQHRSVYFVSKLEEHFRSQSYNTLARHRELA